VAALDPKDVGIDEVGKRVSGLDQSPFLGVEVGQFGGVIQRKIRERFERLAACLEILD